MIYVEVDNVLYQVETDNEEIAMRAAFQMRRRRKPDSANELCAAAKIHRGPMQQISAREARLMVLGHE